MGKPKISWNAAHAVVAYCKEHNIHYSNETTYPNTFASGLRHNRRTSNGMLYHLPREREPWGKNTWQSANRVYLCWYGEPIEQVIESLAFCKMTTNRELWVLRCKSIATTKRKGLRNGDQLLEDGEVEEYHP